MTTQQKKDRIVELTAFLSEAARKYEQEDTEIISNYEYDRLYDELKSLEDETGIVLAGSPTHKVGYEVLSDLPKETHPSPMLSLNKTKSREELASWLNVHEGVMSWKMDGLTIVLTYRDGSLYKAVTRGNGTVGEVITPNARQFMNLPMSIPFKGELVLRGEAVIRYSDFEKINASITDVAAKYKNPRNLCSGSVRQLDSGITAKRRVYLYAFALISITPSEDDAAEFSEKLGMVTTRSQQLDLLESLGFTVVDRQVVSSSTVADTVASFEGRIPSNDFPTDGLVLIYNDIAYGNSLGSTAKFPRDGIAFKWQDETATTTLREIEWSASRTGLINPVAVFDPVELEGTTVTRASVHNISIVEQLKLGIGDSINVYKANMIIPQIADNLTCSGRYELTEDMLTTSIRIEDSLHFYNNPVVPVKCPVCGRATMVHEENDVRTLICPNPECSVKKLKLFALLASRDSLNIDGLSESTLEKLLSYGIVHTLPDMFRLSEKRDLIADLEGLGEKSADNLINAIEKSKNCKLSALLYGMGIDGIGLSTSKLICKKAGNNPETLVKLTTEDLLSINGIGDVLAASFVSFFKKEENLAMFREIQSLVHLTTEDATVTGGTSLEGLTFVITGSVYKFSNRSELKTFIEDKGGKVTGSVTKNTSYLINNDFESASSKNKTAKELGVPIITEDDFLNRFDS